MKSSKRKKKSGKIPINNSDAALHLNLSNHYLALNDLNKAEQHLNQALRINPHYAEAYNNLGRLLYKQNLFDKAIPVLEKALRLNPDYFDAHYNLAHAFSQLNQFNQAQHHYSAALKLKPEHSGAHNNLGLILFETENYEDARIHLEKACSLDPHNHGSRLFLGQTYLALGKTLDAKQLYEALLAEDDTLFEAHHNLAVLLLRDNNKSQSLLHFKKVLQYQPNNETALHMVKALEGETPDAPIPKGYVRDLFNQYADYYNVHVKEKLHYQAPFLLRDAIAKCLKGKSVERILDLGCGTGLCSIYFRDMTRILIGVDISEKMIDKAKQLEAYDELKEQDILEYLGESAKECKALEKNISNESKDSEETRESNHDIEPILNKFNLILASDVLVYFGDLDRLFQLISQNLTFNGHFAFTIELLKPMASEQEKSNQNKGYLLQPTGRFAHSPEYIQSLSKKYGFNIQLANNVILRKQEEQEIPGMLYVLSYMQSNSE